MRLETYPDRDFLCLKLADLIAEQLAETLRLRGPGVAVGAGRHHAGAGLRHAVGGGHRLGQCRGRAERRTLGARNQPAVEHPAFARAAVAWARGGGAADAALRAGPRRPKTPLPALEDALRPHLPISVLLLGMGADMHTASLFPGADRLAEALGPTRR
jgi:6-phosphogluconolactonase